jgi:tetratricopeptide (TPR) repeat protein
MKFKFKIIFFCALLTTIFSAHAQTNFPTATTNNNDVANGYLQIQEQLQATRIAIEDSRELAAQDSKKNADELSARMQALEQTVAAQRASDADAARKTQQLTLMLAGAFGLAGLGIMLLMVYFQWRAFTQIAQISAQQNAALLNSNSIHQLAAPGRATVETSNNRLLDVVGKLEQRIHELENGNKSLPENVATRPADLLAEGQKFLDANAPEKALNVFEKFLATHPRSAEALLKMATALEKLNRTDEALAVCDAAIAVDESLVAAYLQKGGLLNRLNRHDEALSCFEHALHAQEKKSARVS